MLAGLMSRWARPASWAKPSAAATSLAISAACLAVSGWLVAQDLGQRAALHVLHGDEVGARVLAPVVDVDDVGVAEVGGRLGLAAEALDEVGVDGELGEQHLDRHLAVEQQVAGEEHVGHTAAPDPLVDLVAVVDETVASPLLLTGSACLAPSWWSDVDREERCPRLSTSIRWLTVTAPALIGRLRPSEVRVEPSAVGGRPAVAVGGGSVGGGSGGRGVGGEHLVEHRLGDRPGQPPAGAGRDLLVGALEHHGDGVLRVLGRREGDDPERATAPARRRR